MHGHVTYIFGNGKGAGRYQSTPDSLTVWLRTCPHVGVVQRHRLPNLSRSTVTSCPSWETAAPNFEAALFLLLGEGILAPLSPLSSGEERSISPDSVSDLPLEQRSSGVFSLSSLPSLAGAWYGAEASILVSTGLAESSGRRAGHLIRSTFFIQP